MATKPCKQCEAVLPLDAFSKNAGCRYGVDSRCRECKKANRHETRLADVDRRLMKTYGLSLVDYRLLQLAQGDVCKICGEKETDMIHGKVKNLAVDHDHASGEVRGLLCARCNRAIGLMNDDVQRLLSAADYLGGIQV